MRRGIGVGAARASFDPEAQQFLRPLESVEVTRVVGKARQVDETRLHSDHST